MNPRDIMVTCRPHVRQACAQVACTANSEMVRQLVRRAQLLAPLPHHRTQGLSRHEMLEAAFAHLDVDGSGELQAHECMTFCRSINPAHSEREAREMMAWMDKDDDARISKPEYMDAMEFLTTILSDEDFEHGILETLAAKPSIADLPSREVKLLALFQHLDTDGSGALDVDELLAVSNDANPAADYKAAKAQLAWLDGDGDAKVSAAEFVEAMTFLTGYLSDEDFDTSLAEQLAYDSFTYKFGAAFLGQKGVLAMLPALRVDQKFTSLILRGCGLHNEGVAALAAALSGHACIAHLDVGDNPISEGGVAALVQLCAATPSLKEVLYDGCYFVRGWSDISSNVDPDPNTGGAPLRAAIERNRNPPPPPLTGDAAVAALDVGALLVSRRLEVKALFYQLAGADGRVSFGKLRDGLAARGEAWGVLPSHLVDFISPAHIFRFASRGDGDGAGGGDGSTLSYAEFARALRSEKARAKVLEAFKRQRVQLKVLFYSLAGVDGELTLGKLAEGLQGALEEQAEDWGFTAAEMRAVLSPENFGAGSGQKGQVTEEDAGATAGDGDLDSDVKLPWREFYSKLAGLQ